MTMRSKWLKATLFAGASFVLVGPASAAPPASSYEAMVASIRAGHTDADYLALRQAYAKSEDYDPYGTKLQTLVPEMLGAFGNKDCKTAMADAGKIGAIDYTDIDAHLVAALCFEDMGDKTQSAFERAVFSGLVDSIVKSGDGRTPATAYRVVTLAEEYTLLTLFKLDSKGQALIQQDGHSYDRFEVSADDTKDEGEIFFEIDPILASFERDSQK